MHASGAVQALPAQHGWLVAPQAAHVPPAHTLPALHMFPAQHGWVAPPQTTQVEPLQALPALHVLPAQQGEPTTPQTPASASGALSGGASFVAPSTTSEVDWSAID
jgi:hypothetical protein